MPPSATSASAAFDHALAHDLVDRRFHEGVRDRLARAVALPVVRDPGGVGSDVAAELAECLQIEDVKDAGY